jgi:hypothetical protein
MLGSMYGSLMGLVSGGCPCALDEDGKSRLVSSGVLSSRVLSSRVVLCLILSCSSSCLYLLGGGSNMQMILMRQS